LVGGSGVHRIWNGAETQVTRHDRRRAVALGSTGGTPRQLAARLVSATFEDDLASWLVSHELAAPSCAAAQSWDLPYSPCSQRSIPAGLLRSFWQLASGSPWPSSRATPGSSRVAGGSRESSHWRPRSHS